MTFETEGERLLFAQWRTASDLRKAFPYMAFLLEGEFGQDEKGKPKFKVYEEGRVVSRTLVQSQDPSIKNPTVGIILPTKCSFPTGSNTKTLKVLVGRLEAWVNDGPISILQRDGIIEAPANTDLRLAVYTREPCFYICRYAPRKAAGE